MKKISKKILVALSLMALGQMVLAKDIITKPKKVKNAISDTTIDFSGGKGAVVEYFAPDGTTYGRSKKYGNFSGHWYVRPNATLCIVHDDPNQSGCVFVIRKKHHIEFHRYDDVVEGPFPIEKGNPNQL